MRSVEDPIGATFLGKLRVVRPLGRGGLGSVYEVEHLVTRNRHALKVLHARFAMDADAVSRLVREAGVSGRVKSPRLVSTLDVGRLEDGRTYVLMELLEGRTWHERLRAEGSLHPNEAVRLGLMVCEGLAAAHAAGVVHRDLKPGNVQLVGEPGREEVKLLDYGLAKNLPGFTDQFGALTVEGGVMGTPQYLSPEQGRGSADVDGRTDQYALAVILYESLTGRRAFEGANVAEVITRIHQGRFTPIRELAPQVPPALAAAVERAMSREREARFARIEDFAAALAPFAGAVDATSGTHELRAHPSAPPSMPSVPATAPPAMAPPTAPPATAPPATAPPATAPPRPRPIPSPAPPNPARSRRLVGALAGALALLLLAGGVFVGWRLVRRRRARARAARPAPAEPIASAAEPTLPAPEPALPAPEPEGALPGIPAHLSEIARALPNDVLGLTRTLGPVASRQNGRDVLSTGWRTDEPGSEVYIAIHDGYEGAPYLLRDQPLLERDGYFVRATTVRGFPARHLFGTTGGISTGLAECLIGGRFRVATSSERVADGDLVRRALAAVDLPRLERLAR